MTNEEYKEVMCENCTHNCTQCNREKIRKEKLEDGVISWKCLNYERAKTGNE